MDEYKPKKIHSHAMNPQLTWLMESKSLELTRSRDEEESKEGHDKCVLTKKTSTKKQNDKMWNHY